MNSYVRRELRNLHASILVGFRVNEIRLVDQHHRPGSTFLHNSKVALHTAQVEIRPGISHNHHHVDIGRHDLFLTAFARGFARKAGLSRETRPDDVFIFFPGT